MVNWDNRIAMGLMCVVLAVAAVTDWRYGKVFNWITIPGIVAGLALWAVLGFLHHGASGAAAELGKSAVGLAVALVPFAVIFFLGGLGGGDVKLMAAVGSISASWQCVVGTAFYAFLVIGLMAIVVMIRKGIVRRTLSRVMSAAMTAVARVKPDIPADGPLLPFSTAVAVGGVLAGCEQLLNVLLPWSALSM